MVQVDLEEARVQLRDLIDAVLKGEKVYIVKDLQAAVQLVPAVPPTRREFGSAKGFITMAEDFDASLLDFDVYMP